MKVFHCKRCQEKFEYGGRGKLRRYCNACTRIIRQAKQDDDEKKAIARSTKQPGTNQRAISSL